MSKDQSIDSEFNRRDFLRGGSFATVMALLGGVPLLAQEQKSDKPSEEKPAGAKVKCAVIGLGAWGRDIVNTLMRVPQADLAVICDTYAASIRRAGTLAPSAKTTEDYKTILADKEITAVIVATPTHLHKEVVLAALKAGKHVYCEAPLAHTAEDAKEIAQAAKDAFKQVFQSGLQNRSDPQRKFVLDFVRSGALGKWVKVRMQWHKKQSWRTTSPNPEREKALNWRLDSALSCGLAGELGVHQIDQAALFLNSSPVSVIGSGFVANDWGDNREVPDTVQAAVEFPSKLRCLYEATLANSYESAYEVYYGTDAAVLIRESKAWLFKEVDAGLLGWEVYAKKEQFHDDTGISLKMGATQKPKSTQPNPDEVILTSPLYLAIKAFIGNAAEITAAVEDYIAVYDPNDRKAFEKNLASITLRPAATWKEGYDATVMAVKMNEAIVKGEKVAFQKAWFELA